MSNINDEQVSNKVLLEGIGHVVSSICLRWGTRELDTYINSMLLDSRDGKRQGFPMEIVDDMLFLLAVNKIRRAHDLQKKSQIDFKEAFRLVEIGDHQAHYGQNDPWVSAHIPELNKEETAEQAKASRMRRNSNLAN